MLFRSKYHHSTSRFLVSYTFEVKFKEQIGKNYSGISIGMRIMNQEDKPVGTWFSKPVITIDSNEINILNFNPICRYHIYCIKMT